MGFREIKDQRETYPSFGRQVNKKDKSEIARCGDTIGKSITDQKTVLIEIPKRYEKIILTVIRFLAARENGKEKKDYLDFCTKIKRLWETDIKYKNNSNKIEADKKGMLHPSIYMWINGTKTFLTQKDILILLEYPFNVNCKHIVLTLDKLNIKTLRGIKPRIGIIYQWKIYEDWKTRERQLLKNYWNLQKSNQKEFRKIKDRIYSEIEQGKFDDQIEEIKQRIIENHS